MQSDVHEGGNQDGAHACMQVAFKLVHMHALQSDQAHTCMLQRGGVPCIKVFIR